MELEMKQAGFFDVVKTVLAGALGVRRRTDHERETVRIRPLHIIIAGLIAAVLFVLTLVTIVRLIVAG